MTSSLPAITTAAISVPVISTAPRQRAARGQHFARLYIAAGFAAALLLPALLLAGGLAPAKAASFDCKKATQPLDKRICGDAELSKLDEDLAAAYGKAKAGLSPAGQKALQTGQHDWLGYSRRLCKTRLDPKVAQQQSETPEDCLKGEYRDRIEALEAAVTQSAGFTFGRVDTFELTPNDPKAPNNGDFSYTKTSWPRIDVAPAGIDPAIWNKVMAAAAQKLAAGDNSAPASSDQSAPTPPAADSSAAAPAASDGDTATAGDQGAGDQAGDDADGGDDIDIGYNFGLVTPQLISLELSMSEMSKGAAHPGGSSEVHTVFLADGRSLTPQDLFRPDKDWQGYLAKRSHDAWVTLLEGSDTPDDMDKNIADVVKDPVNWLLTDKGITVDFPFYSVGPYVLGEQQVDFTWDELKPYLVDKLPFTRS